MDLETFTIEELKQYSSESSIDVTGMTRKEMIASIIKVGLSEWVWYTHYTHTEMLEMAREHCIDVDDNQTKKDIADAIIEYIEDVEAKL